MFLYSVTATETTEENTENTDASEKDASDKTAKIAPKNKTKQNPQVCFYFLGFF